MLRRLNLAKAVECLLLAAVLVVCLSLYRVSAQENAAAEVITLNGQVSVLRDNMPWALNVGDKVQPRQIIFTGADGFAVFKVSDGSTFEVFPNSRTIFRESPANWKDILDVLIGRVKVHIQKLGGQPNHNRVRTPTAVISVRGTIFDVVVEDEDATTFVSVDEGQVMVENWQTPGGGPKILNAGESIRIFKNQPLARRVDKGSAAQTLLRAAANALYDLIYRSPRTVGGASGAGGGTPLPGDRGGGTGKPPGGTTPPGTSAPPPAPPPPPPPPPPGP